MFEDVGFAGHESVHHFYDEKAGLRGLVAIHSTNRGPAAGGCRMWAYNNASEALTDVLRLSKGMSYKNAMADLPLGGGKAVIWGNAKTDKTPELFQALGRGIDSLGGRYYTAEDVGVTPADMDEIAKETKFVAGLSSGDASGDPSPVTARGVFLGIKAAAQRAFGTDDLNGKHVAVQGVGHVGGGVCLLLAEAGASLTITDVDEDALALISKQTGAKVVAPGEIYDVEADVFSPNALGAVVNPKTIDRFRCKVIAGGANNQLLVPEMGEALMERGILYAPDYVINGGGIINIAAEIAGEYDPKWVEMKVNTMIDTLGNVLDRALNEARAPNRVADDIAIQRIGEST